MDGIEMDLIPAKRNPSDVFKQIQSMNDDKINIPQKKCCYHHFQLIVIIFIQIASIWSLLNQFYSDQFSQVVEWIVVVLINLFCIFASYFVSNIKRHLDDLRNISELNIDYERIRNSTVELSFSIECYHYRESLNSRSKSSQKIVTHRADKTIKLSKCYDFSGHIQDNIQNSFSRPYVFIDYEAGFEFLEQVQQIILDNMEKDFKQKNTRDDYQNYKKTFNFTDCEEKSRAGYVLKGNWSSFKHILALSSVLMLSWPVSMIMEIFCIERYKIRIVKKIKLEQDQQGYQNTNY